MYQRFAFAYDYSTTECCIVEDFLGIFIGNRAETDIRVITYEKFSYLCRVFVFSNCSVMEERFYLGCRFSLMTDPRFSVGGKRNIVARVYYQRKRHYVRICDAVTDDEWKRMMCASKGEFYRRRMDVLAAYDAVYAKAVSMLAEGRFDVSALADCRVDVPRISAMPSWCSYSQSTRRRWKSAALSYERHIGNDRIDDITSARIGRWMSMMSAEGLSTTTQRIYVATMSAMMNVAVAKGHATSNPFRSVRKPRGETRRDSYLSREEWATMRLYVDDCEWLRWLLISYLCNGMNMADMACLRYDDHYFRSGCTEFRYRRKKTEGNGIDIYIPITDALKDLMEPVAERPRNGALVFPQISGSSLRSNEQAVFNFSRKVSNGAASTLERIGLPRITPTWCRHSYKTTLMLLGVPERFTEQMLGHADGSVGGHYAGWFTPEQRMEYNSMLLP